MKKIINDKEYELVSGPGPNTCDQCAFRMLPSGCSLPLSFGDDCIDGDYDKIWKEVDNE